MRCKAKNKKGKQCGSIALKDGSGMCVSHSDSKQAKQIRRIRITRQAESRMNVWSNKKLIKILQKELKELDKIEDPAVRINEKRKTVELILKLGGKGMPTKNDEEPKDESIQDKLKKWKKKD